METRNRLRPFRPTQCVSIWSQLSRPGLASRAHPTGQQCAPGFVIEVPGAVAHFQRLITLAISAKLNSLTDAALQSMWRRYTVDSVGMRTHLLHARSWNHTSQHQPRIALSCEDLRNHSSSQRANLITSPFAPHRVWKHSNSFCGRSFFHVQQQSCAARAIIPRHARSATESLRPCWSSKQNLSAKFKGSACLSHLRRGRSWHA